MTNSAGDKDNLSIIPFRNIKESFLPLPEYEEKIKKICSKKYNFPFFVKTVDRLFELYASEEKERTLWMAAFDYLIKSTNEVQKIITENNN
jgi:UDP-galactopyranose mutase